MDFVVSMVKVSLPGGNECTNPRFIGFGTGWTNKRKRRVNEEVVCKWLPANTQTLNHPYVSFYSIPKKRVFLSVRSFPFSVHLFMLYLVHYFTFTYRVSLGHMYQLLVHSFRISLMFLLWVSSILNLPQTSYWCLSIKGLSLKWVKWSVEPCKSL